MNYSKWEPNPPDDRPNPSNPDPDKRDPMQATQKYLQVSIPELLKIHETFHPHGGSYAKTETRD